MRLCGKKVDIEEQHARMQAIPETFDDLFDVALFINMKEATIVDDMI